MHAELRWATGIHTGTVNTYLFAIALLPARLATSLLIGFRAADTHSDVRSWSAF